MFQRNVALIKQADVVKSFGPLKETNLEYSDIYGTVNKRNVTSHKMNLKLRSCAEYNWVKLLTEYLINDNE